MRASNGAIEKVKIDEKTLNPTLTTIGDADPIGICGSGIIDLICQMILTGIIDRRGKIHRDIDNRRIRFNEYEMGEYVLAFKEEYNLEQDITVNEVDIDNFIKAKGAIYSGASVLIESLGMDFSVIDKVYIAGGIGNNLNIENSILIGLLPDIEREKFVYEIDPGDACLLHDGICGFGGNCLQLCEAGFRADGFRSEYFPLLGVLLVPDLLRPDRDVDE